MQKFRGAVEQISAGANAWSDAGRQIKASVVSVIGETPQSDWRFLDEFLTNNTLIPDANQVLLPSRTIESWAPSTDRTVYRFENEVDFGSPAPGQNIAGVLTWEDTGVAATSPLWFFDDNPQAFPVGLMTEGGPLKWGSAGTNVIGWKESIGGQLGLAGAARDWNELANPWTNAANNFSLRAVVDTGVTTGNADWVTLQDVIDAGVNFAMGTSDAPVPSTHRAVGWQLIGGDTDQWQHTVNPSANGDPAYFFPNVPIGQNIVSVLMFRDTGNPATSRVWHWDAAFSPVATTNGNVTYGNGQHQIIVYEQL